MLGQNIVVDRDITAQKVVNTTAKSNIATDQPQTWLHILPQSNKKQHEVPKRSNPKCKTIGDSDGAYARRSESSNVHAPNECWQDMTLVQTPITKMLGPSTTWRHYIAPKKSEQKNEKRDCWVVAFGGARGEVVNAWRRKGNSSSIEEAIRDGLPSPIAPRKCNLRFAIIDAARGTPLLPHLYSSPYEIFRFMPVALVGKDRDVIFHDETESGEDLEQGRGNSLYKSATNIGKGAKWKEFKVPGWSIRTTLQKIGVKKCDFVALWFNAEGAEFEAINEAMGDGTICNWVDHISVFLHYKHFRGGASAPFRLVLPEELRWNTVDSPKCRVNALIMGPGYTLDTDLDGIRRSIRKNPYPNWPFTMPCSCYPVSLQIQTLANCPIR